MKLGYTIVYVPNVAESLTFFESACGLSRRFLHDVGDYGELESGETTVDFASPLHRLEGSGQSAGAKALS
jgi:hypothetical protein